LVASDSVGQLGVELSPLERWWAHKDSNLGPADLRVSGSSEEYQRRVRHGLSDTATSPAVSAAAAQTGHAGASDRSASAQNSWSIWLTSNTNTPASTQAPVG